MMLSTDEEVQAVNGLREVVPQLKKRALLPDACLVGEPSSSERLGDVMRVGRRGSIQAVLKVSGVQGHTAYARARDNPAHRAGPRSEERRVGKGGGARGWQRQDETNTRYGGAMVKGCTATRTERTASC